MKAMDRRRFIQLSLAGLGAAGRRGALAGAAGADSNQGELLYNGIQLPAQ